MNDAACWRGQEIFLLLQSLLSNQQKGADRRKDSDREPKAGEDNGRFKMQKPSGESRKSSERSRQRHYWSQRATIDRGPFHQCANHFQVFGGFIGFHAQHFAMQSERLQVKIADQDKQNESLVVRRISVEWQAVVELED